MHKRLIFFLITLILGGRIANCFAIEQGDFIKEKGNMDVEMTIDIIHFKKEYKEVILFTGDSDFLALVNYLKNELTEKRLKEIFAKEKI